MNLIRRISFFLAACCYLALPLYAQKNIKSLPRALAWKNQYAHANSAQALPLTIKTLKIVNLPSRPSVHILFDTPLPHKSTIRLVPPRQVYPLLYKLGEHKIFIPREFVNATKSLYRGMTLTDIDKLKNILVNGLEINKSNFKEGIFTAYDPLTAILYAQPTHFYDKKADIPVLIKIPITPFLEQCTSIQFETARAFRQNIPASAISDVWILLEVNKKADWYRVILEDGEIVLFPAHGRLQDVE